jgi:hypothetical protein
MLLVGGSLFHGSEREICWIVTLQKGTKREFCSTDMLATDQKICSKDVMALLHGTEREICWLDMLLVKGPLCSKERNVLFKRVELSWGLFITRNGSGNLFNRYVISWGLFISRLGTGNLLNSYATERNETGILFNRHVMASLYYTERNVKFVE